MHYQLLYNSQNHHIFLKIISDNFTIYQQINHTDIPPNISENRLQNELNPYNRNLIPMIHISKVILSDILLQFINQQNYNMVTIIENTIRNQNIIII